METIISTKPTFKSRLRNAVGTVGSAAASAAIYIDKNSKDIFYGTLAVSTVVLLDDLVETSELNTMINAHDAGLI